MTYVPNTEEVRWIFTQSEETQRLISTEEAEVGFDTWLTGVLRAAQVEAFRKAAADVRADWFPDSCGWVGYLDDRADQIEAGA